MDAVRLMGLVVAGVATLAACVVPSAAAAPATDDGGYVNSSARCTAPSTVVVFGATDASRVAICKTSDGSYEYRGVRLSDGAKLTVAAEPSGDGNFFAENNGIGYMVTAKSLVISAGDKLIRDEPMVDFHGQQAPAPAPTPTTPTTPLPPPLAAEKGGGGR